MRRLYFILQDYALVGGDYFMIRNLGTRQPIPPVFDGRVFFILFPHSCEQCFGHKTKNPQALPEGFVEVGGGFEPP